MSGTITRHHALTHPLLVAHVVGWRGLVLMLVHPPRTFLDLLTH